MPPVVVATLSLSASALTRSYRSSSRDDEDHRYDEINNLHDVMKCGHLALEEVDERCENEAGYEGRKKRSETSSVKEVSFSLLGTIVGMRLAHADNLTQLPAVWAS